MDLPLYKKACKKQSKHHKKHITKRECMKAVSTVQIGKFAASHPRSVDMFIDAVSSLPVELTECRKHLDKPIPDLPTFIEFCEGLP